MADKKARDIMTPECKCVGENDSIIDAAKQLAELDVGVSVFPEDARDLRGLLHVADLRMYDAKRTATATG